MMQDDAYEIKNPMRKKQKMKVIVRVKRKGTMRYLKRKERKDHQEKRKQMLKKMLMRWSMEESLINLLWKE